MKGAPIATIAENILKPMLGELGFKRRESGIYTLDLGNGFLGWLGMPRAVKSGVVAISPVIGIRHQQTQNLLSQLLGEDIHPYLPPTVCRSLGFFLPEGKWREWYFDENDDVSEYRSMVDPIEDAALPFVRDHADLAGLDAMLENYEYVVLQFDQHERLPIVKYLLGDFEGAIPKLREYARSLEGNTSERASRYRNVYAPALINLMKDYGG